MRLGWSLLLAGQVDVARAHFEAAADEAARTGEVATLTAGSKPGPAAGRPRA